MSSEDTRMTWTEDRSTPSSGPPTDDYCCNNSYNDDSDHDNVFISQDIDTRGSTDVLRHYGSLGIATCCHNGYKELLCGGNSIENITCNGHSSNTTTQALRHLGKLLVAHQVTSSDLLILLFYVVDCRSHNYDRLNQPFHFYWILIMLFKCICIW